MSMHFNIQSIIVSLQSMIVSLVTRSLLAQLRALAAAAAQTYPSKQSHTPALHLSFSYYLACLSHPRPYVEEEWWASSMSIARPSQKCI